jgi:6-phosphogluconolactonase (cycloisomerase 2 family)
VASTAALAAWSITTGTSCSGGGEVDGSFPAPEGTPVGAGFASSLSLVVTSEDTPQTLALLSVDEATGALGIAGGPLDVMAPIGDVETAAVDVAARRVFVGSDLAGTVSVANVAATGALAPIAGSPFPLESAAPTVVHPNAANDLLYVGYRGEAFISVLPVDPATGAVGAALPRVPISGSSIETLRSIGNLLYVICNSTENILAFRIEANGELTDLGVDVLASGRPDYIEFIGDGVGMTRLYVSTVAGLIDGFEIDVASGALTPLPGSPYVFPGLTTHELLRASDDGIYLGLGTESPPAVALFRVELDGSLTPLDFVPMHAGLGGPEGIVWTPNGRFLIVADHTVGGIFVFERIGDTLQYGPVPRYLLPGRPIDLVLSDLAVSP